jgi:hypothetical protein
MRPAAAAALSATTAYSTWSARPSLPRGVYPPTQVLQMMSAFIKALLPPVLSEVLRTAGSLRSTDVTPFPRYCGPIRHPLVVGRFPGVAGYTAYPASAISGRDKEGFSSCSMFPGHHAVANHPAGATRRINWPATNCTAFALQLRARPPELLTFEATARSLALRPGNLQPSRGWRCRGASGSSVSLRPALRATRLPILAPAGLTPAGHISLFWTHNRT